MSFEFQLVLTEKCNMSCTYCYIKQKPSDMTREVFDAHYSLLPLILRSYNEQNYHAALFGGEPLLNWDLIEYIVPILKRDPKCTQIVVMTNGIVLQKEGKLDWLIKNEIGISLSFDGLWNDINRPLLGGKSSLPIYMEKDKPLYKYLTSGKSCKVMVSPSSVPTMVDNYKWFVETLGVSSPDYSLVRDQDWTDKDVSLFKKEIKLLADQNIKYIQEGIQSSVGFFQLAILDMLFGEAYDKRPFGCFAGCHGAGFMPDGKVYPCARFGSNEKIILFDSLKKLVYKENFTKINDPNVSDIRTFEKCKKCILYNYCNAGCTWSQLGACTKDSCEPIDTICQLFFSVYEEAIRITHELKNNELFRDMIKRSIQNVG